MERASAVARASHVTRKPRSTGTHVPEIPEALSLDAANNSDQPRVLLWLDIARPMPRSLEAVDRAALWIAFHDPSIEQVRRNAVVFPTRDAAPRRSEVAALNA